MVATESQGRLGYRFILRPNCSASWSDVKRFLAITAMVSLGIASMFAWAGFWPVLPFAGLEVALLAYAMYSTSARARETEVVDIDELQIAVEKGRTRPERCWRFQRSWARVFLVAAPFSHHPSRLYIGSCDRRIALGSFLTESERQELAREIRNALAGEPVKSPAVYEQEHWS